jgi:hypothetical protein
MYVAPVFNEKAHHHRIVDAWRLSATTPVSLNGCNDPWRDVSRPAFNNMEDILRIYYKFTLSAITHKLNASGHMLILSRVLVTKTGFELVIGFINHARVVTTINYITVPYFYTTKHSTLIFSAYLHCSSRIYHTGTTQVWPHHTLPISLWYSTHKVFRSHVKSSQSDLLYTCAAFFNS